MADHPNPIKSIRFFTRVYCVLIALYCFVRGYAYLPSNAPPDLPGVLQILTEQGVHVVAWSVIWMLAGFLSLIGTFIGPQARWCGMGVAMAYVWGAGYLFSYAESYFGPEPTSRDYLPASTYLIPAGIFTLFLLLIDRMLPYFSPQKEDR